MDAVEELVKKIVAEGVLPSMETYNTLIDGYRRLCAFHRCSRRLIEGNYMDDI